MQSLSDLVNLAARFQRDGTSVAVATLVKKEGSTYRQPGARMLVEADGTAHGILGGGCLKGDVVRQALVVLRTGSAVVRRYDLSEGNALLGFGAGCNGVAYVLIEPGTSSLDMLQPFLEQRQTAVLAHIIRCPEYPDLLGARQLLISSLPVHASANWPPALCVASEAFGVLSGARPPGATYELAMGSVDVFLEVARPPVRLIVFGSGPDVGPLVCIARAIGWSVSVVGGKPAAALKKLAPGASEYTFLMHPDQALNYVRMDNRSAAIVMNHNMNRDAALVHVLLKSPIPYIGVLGPRERSVALIPGGGLDELTSGRVFGPVGLDIGAETPEEIALCIVAEVQRVLSGHGGGSLRDKPGAVHRVRPGARSLVP